MRALAIDVGMSHTTIRKVLKGDLRLGLESVKKIALKLKLFDRDLDQLLAESRLECEPDASIKKILETAANETLADQAQVLKISTEDLAEFKLLQVFLVLESFGLNRDRKLSLSDLLQYTGLKKELVESILNRLVELKLLQRIEGKGNLYQRENKRFELISQKHSRLVKDTHREAIDQILSGIEKISPGDRYSATEFVLIPASKMTEFKESCFRFTKELHQIKSETNENDTVMLVSLHAIPWLRKSPS